MRASSVPVPPEQLQLSRAPHADLTSAAVEARRAARLDTAGETAGYLIVAVEPGRLADAQELVDAALANA